MVEEITKQGYVSGEECLPFEWGNEIHLWSINDAKPGDIIVESSRYITIYQNHTPTSDTTFRSFCFVNLDSNVFVDVAGSHNIRGSYPATKEQCELLFKKIKEAGYEWDKKAKKLVNSTLKEKERIDTDFIRMIKKSEDKKMIEDIISDLKGLKENETNEELISDYEREIEWLKEKI